MHRTPALILILTMALPAVAAEPKFDPEARARTIAPLVDNQTLAVVHLDLSRIDVERLATKAKEIGKLEAEELDRYRKPLEEWLTAFRRAGGKDLYAVLSLSGLPTSPLVFVPLEAKADAQAVAKLLSNLGLTESEVRDRGVFAGKPHTMARFRTTDAPKPNPEVERAKLTMLSKAFDAAGDSTAQIILTLTPELRRALEEAMPALPKEIGGGSTKSVTRGLLWIAVGLDLTPSFSLRVVIQAADADSAKSLRGLINSVLTHLARKKELRALFSDVDKIINLLIPTVAGDRLSLNLDEKQLTPILQPAAALQRAAGDRRRTEDSLRRIASALHNFHNDHKTLPAAYSQDNQGKPLLSWRVHLLPYLGEDKLYKEFKLNEPWDSEHNKKLIERMPAIYASHNRKLNEVGMTVYLAPIHESAVWTGGKPIRLVDIKDGSSNTVLLVPVADEHAVIWTKPEDWKLDLQQPTKGLRRDDAGNIPVLIVDGAIRWLSEKLESKIWRAAFTRSGSEV